MLFSITLYLFSHKQVWRMPILLVSWQNMGSYFAGYNSIHTRNTIFVFTTSIRPKSMARYISFSDLIEVKLFIKYKNAYILKIRIFISRLDPGRSCSFVQVHSLRTVHERSSMIEHSITRKSWLYYSRLIWVTPI